MRACHVLTVCLLSARCVLAVDSLCVRCMLVMCSLGIPYVLAVYLLCVCHVRHVLAVCLLSVLCVFAVFTVCSPCARSMQIALPGGERFCTTGSVNATWAVSCFSLYSYLPWGQQVILQGSFVAPPTGLGGDPASSQTLHPALWLA